MPEGEEELAHSQDSQTDEAPASQSCSLAVKNRSRRKDTGRLHAVRHGALSRHPLEALRHLGEDPKSFRRLERKFRAELKPRGAVAEIVFDRFWASYLRCLLAARTEAGLFLRRDEDRGKELTAPPRLLHGDVPTLIADEAVELGSTPKIGNIEQDLLRGLALVQRYDRHFGKEMYGALALLLVMRRSGEAGLEDALAQIFGIRG